MIWLWIEAAQGVEVHSRGEGTAVHIATAATIECDHTREAMANLEGDYVLGAYPYPDQGRHLGTRGFRGLALITNSLLNTHKCSRKARHRLHPHLRHLPKGFLWALVVFQSHRGQQDTMVHGLRRHRLLCQAHRAPLPFHLGLATKGFPILMGGHNNHRLSTRYGGHSRQRLHNRIGILLMACQLKASRCRISRAISIKAIQTEAISTADGRSESVGVLIVYLSTTHCNMVRRTCADVW